MGWLVGLIDAKGIDFTAGEKISPDIFYYVFNYIVNVVGTRN